MGLVARLVTKVFVYWTLQDLFAFPTSFIAHLVTTLQCKLDLLCRGVCLVIFFATCTTFLLLAYTSFFLVLCWLFSLISRKLEVFLILLSIFMSFLWKSFSLFLSRIGAYFPYRYENIASRQLGNIVFI